MKLISMVNSTAEKMASIDRYSQTRLINPESVLEHTGFVCFCSLVICNELLKNGEEIDVAQVMSRAAIHDIEEVVTGDIACPTKYANSNILNEIKNVERTAAKQICDELDPDGTLFLLWNIAKSGKEGFIVALSDKLAVVYKVYQEVILFGNTTIAGHIDGLVPSLDALYCRARDEKIFTNTGIIRDVISEAIEICRVIKKSKSI